MDQREPSGWAIGWITFAAFMMIMIGSFHVIAGLVAIVDDNFYVAGREYIFKFDRSTWGWIHLLLGILVFLAGIGLFSGAIWARTVGVILALSAPSPPSRGCPTTRSGASSSSRWRWRSCGR